MAATATLEKPTKTHPLNLHAVLPQHQPDPVEIPDDVAEDLKAIDAAARNWPSVKPFLKTNSRNADGENKLWLDFAVTLTKHRREIRAALFGKHGTLPTQLLTDEKFVFQPVGTYVQNPTSQNSWDRKCLTEDRLASEVVSSAEERMCQTPRVLLADLRRVADDLGFLIIPLAYLSQQGRPEKHSVDELALRRFSDDADYLGMQTFVLAPPSYYGVQEHAKAKDPNLPMYDGPHDTLMHVTRQSVLTFRTVFEALGGLERKVDEVEKRLSSTESNLASVQKQMLSLDKGVARIQQQLFAQRAEYQAGIAQARADAARAEAKAEIAIQMILCMMDPLVFAVLPDVELEGDGAAYIGPCWGPDFPAIMAQAYVNGTFDPLANGKEITKQIKSVWYDD